MMLGRPMRVIFPRMGFLYEISLIEAAINILLCCLARSRSIKSPNKIVGV